MSTWTAHALNVRQTGTGPATVVLAHGFGNDQCVWTPYIEHLAGHFRVITYDLACAGSADKAFFDMCRHRDLEGYVTDLLTILDDLSVDRCNFVGHSVSGMIGLMAARRRPGLIEKLIMVGSSACYLNLDDYLGGWDRDTVNQLLITIASDYHAWINAFAPFVVSRPPENPVAMDFAASLRTIRPDIALATAEMILLGDYRDQLAAIEVPAVILQTRNDPAVPLSAAQFMHDHLKGSMLEILDTTGHMPNMTSVEIVEDALWRHLGVAPWQAKIAVAQDARSGYRLAATSRDRLIGNDAR